MMHSQNQNQQQKQNKSIRQSNEPLVDTPGRNAITTSVEKHMTTAAN